MNIVESGQQNDKLIKIKYSEGSINPYNVRCKSNSEKEDLVAQIRSIRLVMLQRK
jgi:hypothetical protein